MTETWNTLVLCIFISLRSFIANIRVLTGLTIAGWSCSSMALGQHKTFSQAVIRSLHLLCHVVAFICCAMLYPLYQELDSK